MNSKSKHGTGINIINSASKCKTRNMTNPNIFLLVCYAVSFYTKGKQVTPKHRPLLQTDITFFMIQNKHDVL